MKFLNNENPLERMVEGYSNTSIFRTVGFIGDSLSSGEFETRDENGNPGYHDLYEYSWGQFMARKNGFKAYNFSRGGMSTKWFIESFGDEFGCWDKKKACQAYVIALGVNDLWGCKMTPGTAEDIEKEDGKIKDTFISYYAEIIRRYKEISPDAKFFFVTLPNLTQPKDDPVTSGMIGALNALAEHFENSYVINLYEYGPVYDEEFKNNYFLYGHLNPMGYVLTAKLVDSYIDYIIRANFDDFKNIGFVGTDIKY